MPLYTLKQNRLHKIEIKKFKEEVTLQDLILNNPEIILEPIGIDTVDDIVFKGKEFGVDGKSIDIIFLTKKGSIYIVETKLYKNSKHREAVAQVLEYGAYLYREANNNPEEIMKRFNLSEENEDGFLNILKENMENGNYNLIVVMDNVPKELKYVTNLLNIKQGLSLYALQIAEYRLVKDEGTKLLEIALFGKTEKRSRSPRYKWILEDIPKEIDKIENEKIKEKFNRLWKSLKELTDKYPDEISIKPGTGSNLSFGIAINGLTNRRMLFSWGLGDFRMYIHFSYIEKQSDLQRKLLKKIYEELNNMDFYLPKDYTEKTPGVPFDKWAGKIDNIIKVINNIAEEIRNNR